MESQEFNAFFAQARQIARSLGVLFEDVTGEELDLNSTIKHYPLVAAGAAAGIGLAAGMWIGRKSAPKLSPPANSEKRELASPLEFLDHVLPDSIRRVREILPESIAEEASTMARTWVDTVLEPRVNQAVDSMAESVAHSRFGSFLKETFEHMEQSEDTRLEDPPETT